MKSTIEKALQRQKQAQLEQLKEPQKQNTIERQFDLDKQQPSDTKDFGLLKGDHINTKINSISELRDADVIETTVRNLNDIKDESHTVPKDKLEQIKPNVTHVNTDNFSKNTLEIDLGRLEELGFVTMSDARRAINEEYREIKRKLLKAAFGPLATTLKNPNIIMVTSARPSEGKTFTAVNLAMSIAAEKDKKVLLVDADVLKPNVLRTLELPPTKGLMDYLQSADPLSEYLCRTNIENLRIIPAGSAHHLSTELLASNAMQETVNEFSTRYPDRIVIIDTPPLIGINESAVLANFAGQAVIVVEEGRSKMSDINKTVDLLGEDMAVGFVVNKSINIGGAGDYSYDYYGQEEKV